MRIKYLCGQFSGMEPCFAETPVSMACTSRLTPGDATRSTTPRLYQDTESDSWMARAKLERSTREDLQQCLYVAVVRVPNFHTQYTGVDDKGPSLVSESE
jgi:hypothetical protein